MYSATKDRTTGDETESDDSIPDLIEIGPVLAPRHGFMRAGILASLRTAAQARGSITAEPLPEAGDIGDIGDPGEFPPIPCARFAITNTRILPWKDGGKHPDVWIDGLLSCCVRGVLPSHPKQGRAGAVLIRELA